MVSEAFVTKSLSLVSCPQRAVYVVVVVVVVNVFDLSTISLDRTEELDGV